MAYNATSSHDAVSAFGGIRVLSKSRFPIASGEACFSLRFDVSFLFLRRPKDARGLNFSH